MICGKGDLLVSPEDYNWLHEELIENGNDVNFFEYDIGHQGVQLPVDQSSTIKVIDEVLQDYSKDQYYKYSNDFINHKVTHNKDNLKF